MAHDGASSAEPDGHPGVWAGRLPALSLVAVVHLALLWWAVSQSDVTPPVLVEPPTLTGVLVSPPPTAPTQPAPRPPEPTPKVQTKPVTQPRPAPPLPKAAPSERAVTQPVEAPVTPAKAEPTVAPAPAAPPVPATPVSAEPSQSAVVPPRSDAAHLNNPAPTYPNVSRRLRQQGRVVLEVYILANGSIGELRLKRSSGFAPLDERALETVRGWRFVPAKRAGEPIPYWYEQAIDFSLDR